MATSFRALQTVPFWSSCGLFFSPGRRLLRVSSGGEISPFFLLRFSDLVSFYREPYDRRFLCNRICRSDFSKKLILYFSLVLFGIESCRRDDSRNLARCAGWAHFEFLRKHSEERTVDFVACRCSGFWNVAWFGSLGVSVWWLGAEVTWFGLGFLVEGRALNFISCLAESACVRIFGDLLIIHLPFCLAAMLRISLFWFWCTGKTCGNECCCG